MRAARQLPLPLPPGTRTADWPFIEATSNHAALALLEQEAAWPEARLLIWGEAGSGKTHLLHRWARRHATAPTEGASLRFPAPAAALAIDDAELAPEETLLHVLNARAEARQPTLLASRAAPARWPITLPDLASRVRAILAVELGAADDALARALFARLFAERQMLVGEAMQDWMRLRLPRHPAALREAACRLDRASLAAGRRVSRELAEAVVDEVTLLWQP